MRLVNKLVFATAVLALGGCASVDKALDTARDLSDHRPEQVTYPNLADVPEKPARPDTTAEHDAKVQALQADRAQLDAAAQKLRDAAAAMPTLKPPPTGQPQ